VLAAGWGRDVCVAQSLVLTWWWYPWLFGQALPAPLRTLLAAILGARFGRGSVAFGKLHDPGLVSVGSGTLIGEDALLAATAWQHGGILLAPIRIGDGVLVGGRSILNPGVVIGDGATIAAGAVVLTGTQVAPGELWGGVPARRLKGAT
jgi:serine acetyltransferase